MQLDRLASLFNTWMTHADRERGHTQGSMGLFILSQAVNERRLDH